MKDLEEFNLLYFRKSDNKAFPVKRVCDGDFVVFDKETNTRIQMKRHMLLKEFEPAKENRLKQKMKRFKYIRKVS